VDPLRGDPYQRKVQTKQEPAIVPLERQVPQFVLSKAKNIVIEAKIRDKDNAEKDKKTVRDVFISEEFEQCRNPKELKRPVNVDYREEVLKSCRDLAIDG
jgi:hypothetical protein